MTCSTLLAWWLKETRVSWLGGGTISRHAKQLIGGLLEHKDPRPGKGFSANCWWLLWSSSRGKGDVIASYKVLLVLSKSGTSHQSLALVGYKLIHADLYVCQHVVLIPCMIKYPVSVVQEKTTILWCSCIILACVDKHFRSFFSRQNAMDLGEREKREVKD